jgi:KDO2-lipid IV(A) lauroyltransferase
MAREEAKSIGQSRFWLWYHRSWIVKRLLSILPWVMQTFPRWFLYLLRYPFLWFYYYGGTSFRKAVRGNIRTALGDDLTEREQRRITKKIFSNMTKVFVDNFHSAFLPEGRFSELVEQSAGWEKVAKALERGTGIIFLTAHVGSWEVGGMILGSMGLEVHLVHLPDQFEAFDRLLKRIRKSKHVIGIPMDNTFETSLRIIRLLGDGKVVAMKGDRVIVGDGITIKFFGRDTLFPKGPALISYISGAPIMLTCVILNENKKYEPIISEPIYPEKTGDRERDVKALVEKNARVMEDFVRRYPDQWYLFYPFWKQDA